MSNSDSINVVILDDDDLMLQLLTKMLENIGFRNVRQFSDGRRVIDLVKQREHSIEVVLCDINMPDMDGVEFIRELVKCNYTGALILVSGESSLLMEMVKKLVMAHGITILGSIPKPPMPAELAALLGKWTPARARGVRAISSPYPAEEVRRAIANGDLENFYQPKVSVTTGKLVGVETLVRWHHSVDGLVLPGSFINVAEKNGLINGLTRLVLTKALAQAKIWQDSGLDLCMAINVSMDNLASLEFADFVDGQAKKMGVLANNVVLEVTESQLLADLRTVLDVMTRLRLKRFRLSIDDFGTGYSSLGQLRDIAFDELKVDRSFVHGSGTDNTIRALFDASLGLARQLGMEVVAEGVEDHDDWNVLREARCDFAQGYFVARPMPAGELLGWVVNWQDRIRDWLPLYPPPRPV